MEWTLDELVGRVAQALARVDVRAPNGRVSEVPDTRMIRWYMTTGLVDRPHAMRGRVGLYGRRHLLQLVAIKRLQGQGLSLAAIQVELAGASDAALEAVARLPKGPAAGDTPEPPRRERFWAHRPAPPARSSAQPHFAPVPKPEYEPAMAASGVLHGVALDGAVLLLPRVPAGADLAAIRAAAQPLLDLLAARGLLPSDPTTMASTATTSPSPTSDEGARG